MPDKRYPPPPEKKNDEFQAKNFTDFNFTRKIVNFVYIILTDFNFTRKIVTFVYIILTDFNFMRKIVIFVWITLTDFLKMDYLTSILRDEIGQAKLGNFLTMFQSKSP